MKNTICVEVFPMDTDGTRQYLSRQANTILHYQIIVENNYEGNYQQEQKLESGVSRIPSTEKRWTKKLYR